MGSPSSAVVVYSSALTVVPSLAAPSEKRSVIVADDCSEQRWLIRKALERLGIETEEVADGPQLASALERKERVAALGATFVIADVNMPVRGGLEVFEAWRNRIEARSFVLMTGFPDDALERRARELGVAILSKPFTCADVARVVRRSFAT